MKGYNPSKTNWVNPNIEYLFNTEIIEYDMVDAGLTIIRYYGLLGKEQIDRLSVLNKEDRNRAIGLLRRNDKIFSKALSDKFAEVRAVFISANNLTDNDIISVKTDAIYTINPVKKSKFGKIEFRDKNIYSSYIRFVDNMNIEIYYSENDIEVKGIGEINVNKHRLYILNFLSTVISYIESDSHHIKKYVKTFIDDYKNDKLDEGYYLEFNNSSNVINKLYNYQKVIVPLTQIILKELG